jgi:hypothetical protein
MITREAFFTVLVRTRPCRQCWEETGSTASLVPGAQLALWGSRETVLNQVIKPYDQLVPRQDTVPCASLPASVQDCGCSTLRTHHFAVSSNRAKPCATCEGKRPSLALTLGKGQELKPAQRGFGRVPGCRCTERLPRRRIKLLSGVWFQKASPLAARAASHQAQGVFCSSIITICCCSCWGHNQHPPAAASRHGSI